jgi:formate dehydrogenase major subunit
MMIKFIVDAQEVETKADELLIDLLLRHEFKVPCVCYHHQLGPIQTCDTCIVEVNGQLGRACATKVSSGMQVQTKSARADAAQREAFDRLLKDHMLYCTVCDNISGPARRQRRRRDWALELGRDNAGKEEGHCH